MMKRISITLFAALLLLAIIGTRTASAWIWDSNENKIDDRLEAVMSGGAAAAHVGGTLQGKLIFVFHPEDNPITFGVYVGYDHLPTDADLAALQATGAALTWRPRYIPYLRARATFSQIQALAGLAGVTRVEAQQMLYKTNDNATRTLRARESKGGVGGSYFPSVWTDFGITGRGIVVGILDTGVNDAADGVSYPGHESLRGKFVGGGDFSNEVASLNTPDDSSTNPMNRVDAEGSYHATHVAGIAIGTGGPEGIRNGAPVGSYAGIAPDARLVDCKVLTDAGEGAGAAQALEWCIAHRDTFWNVPSADAVYRGVQVVNMSLGGATASDGTDADCAAVNAAVKAGIVVCVATGNDGNTRYMPSPAAADLDIAVGSFQDNNTITHSDDVVADYSNEGPRMDDGDADHFDEMKPSVCGSGTDIYSALGDPTTDGHKYHNINGTSMATPTVAGICALILQANPNLSPLDVRTLLQNTAGHRTDHGKQPAASADTFHLDPNYHPSWGWGQPDGVAAVEEALNPNTTQVTEEASTGSALVAGQLQVGIRWVTQREVGTDHFVVWRAPDLGGSAGTFAAVSGPVAPVGHAIIAKVGNRTAYTFSDQDATLQPGATYWYQVRWYEAGGGAHVQPAFQVKTAAKPVRARASWAIAHGSYDSDLVVLYGSGVSNSSPAFVRPTAGTPLADSSKNITPVGFGGGITEYFFHADLTDDDLVAGFLPPSAANPWFLSVLEKGYVNTEGIVDSFTITTYSGSSSVTYRGVNPPTPTVEGQTTVFWIPSNPALALNHSPVISPVGDRSVGEGLHLNFTVQASDPDGNALTYTASGLPLGASFVNSTHVLDWMPAYGQAGSYTVKFMATDPSLAADTETVKITVFSRAPGSNTAPTLQSTSDKTVHVESFLTFIASATDPEGDALTFSASPLPSGASFDASNRTFSWLPHSGSEGSYHVTFRVSDSHGAVDSQSVLVNVQPGGAHLPPAGGCVPDSTVYTGTIGTGVQGMMSDSRTQPFVIPSNTGAVQGSLYWTGAPAIDLDFSLLDAQGNTVNASASLNEPETITVLDPAPGNYTWKVIAYNNPVSNLAYSITSTLCHRTATGVEGGVRAAFALSPNSPNPFARATVIRFAMGRPGVASLRVFDIQGRLTRTLVHGAMGAGAYQRVWDGKRDDEAPAAAGVYFYRLETGEGVLSKKMLLLR